MRSQGRRVLFLKPPSDTKNRNIVRDFVYGCWCNGRRVGGMQMPPLNDLYCATHVRNGGVNIEFLDAQFEPERFEELQRDRFGEIAAVVLLSSTQSFRDDVSLMQNIKSANPKVVSILYGSHPTFMSVYCLKEPAIDYIVLREPEETLRMLCKAVMDNASTDGIEGIGFRNGNGEAKLNPFRPFMDLDDLPIPDRTLLPKNVDYFNPVVKKVPYTTIQTSRGCPATCTFCTAPTFYGNKYRFRSADKVVEELVAIKEQGYREVFFRDETFTAMKSRNIEICEKMLRLDLKLSWIANGRVDMIDRETMTLMKRAGCHMLKFGVESSNDAILRNYKKGITASQTVEAFRIANEIGLDTHAHIMLGGPGETPQTIMDTIQFAKAIKASTASFGIITPYPGTPLFNELALAQPSIKDGSGSNMDNLHTTGFYSENICGLQGKELSAFLIKAYRSFYMRPGYLLGRLRKIESFEELMILVTAGLNIFQFSITGDK